MERNVITPRPIPDFQMSATATEDNQPVVGEVDAKEDAKSKAATETDVKPPGTK